MPLHKDEVAEPQTNGSAAPMLLTREQILAVDDLQTEIVNVPEWGGSVMVRGLTGKERDAFERSMVILKTGKQEKDAKPDVDFVNFRAKLVAHTVIDENGELLFKEVDVTKLGQKSGKALDRVFDVAQRLSGMTDDDVKELTDGLKDVPSADSGSVSH
jgi:hypothetical protein